MNKQKRPFKKPISYLLVLLMVAFFNADLAAQRSQSFSGNYKLKNGDRGTATFHYREGRRGEDSVVLQGKFDYQSEDLDISDGNQIFIRKVKGHYESGRKQGNWVYEFDDYQLNLEGINNLRATTNLTGTEGGISGNFQNGKLHGSWEFKKNRIVESSRRGVIKFGQVSFKEGKANGLLTFRADFDTLSYRMRGDFDEEGRFHGQWTLNFTMDSLTLEEKREYKNGFLLYLSQKDAEKDSILLEVNFDVVKDRLEALSENTEGVNYKIAEENFQIVFDDGYRKESIEMRGQQLGNTLFYNAFESFFDGESLVFNFPGAEAGKIGQTSRFQYVYPEIEKSLLPDLAEASDTLRRKVKSYLDDNSFYVNRRKNDSLAFAHSFFDSVRLKIRKIDAVVEKMQNGYFTYRDRDQYYSKGVPGLDKVDSIFYDFDGEKREQEVVFALGIESGENLIENIGKYTQDLSLKIDTLSLYVDKQLDKYRKLEEINKLEEQLVKIFDRVDKTYVGREKADGYEARNLVAEGHKVNDLQLAVYQNFGLRKKKRMMQAYSEADEVDEKLAKGNELVALMEELLVIYDELEEFPEYKDQLDEAFTRYGFNPFFERDIVTRIKRIVYNKGVELLMTYMLAELKEIDDLELLKEQISQIKQLKENLIVLSKKEEGETGRLERRLRREEDPKVLKELFEVTG